MKIHPICFAAVGLLASALATTRAAEKPAANATIPAFPTVETRVRHATPGKAEELIKEKKVTVLDVRTAGEFKAGHIEAALNVDFNAADFEAKVSGLDRDKNYLVHCASGGRSTKSLEVFKKLKFRSIVHLDGGFKAWEKDGKPVVK